MLTTVNNTTRTVQYVSVGELKRILQGKKGSAFASVVCDYDMTETDKRGQPKKMKKTGNSWLGHGLRKMSKQSILVDFDYDRSLQKRTDGEEQATGGPTWQQALTVNGSLTPLTVHKSDVVEYDPLGNPIRFVNNARFYLRCEFRKGESQFYDPNNGEIVEKDKVNPYLKKQSKGAVDFHVVGLQNVRMLRLGGVEYIVTSH